MDNNDISLKEVLMEVSRKLDRFLETHNTLHNEMAVHEAKADQLLATHEMWGKDVEELKAWKTEVQGNLKLIKWVGSGGLATLALLVLKLLGVPVP